MSKEEVYKKSLKYIMNIESKKEKIADILREITQKDTTL